MKENVLKIVTNLLVGIQGLVATPKNLLGFVVLLFVTIDIVTANNSGSIGFLVGLLKDINGEILQTLKTGGYQLITLVVVVLALWPNRPK